MRTLADTSGKAIHVQPKVKNKSARGDEKLAEIKSINELLNMILSTV